VVEVVEAAEAVTLVTKTPEDIMSKCALHFQTPYHSHTHTFSFKTPSLTHTHTHTHTPRPVFPLLLPPGVVAVPPSFLRCLAEVGAATSSSCKCVCVCVCVCVIACQFVRECVCVPMF